MFRMKNDLDQDFKCLNCGRDVSLDNLIGTLNRNHCPFCLYSKHVDQDFPGDRKAECQNIMEPIGLIFKKEGLDKYGKEKQGEIMLIHFCPKDQKISINRIAGDDDQDIILKIFQQSQNISPEIKEKIKQSEINLLEEKDKPEILNQLFGKRVR